MKTFNEWLKDKSIFRESRFETLGIQDWEGNVRNVPVYINPTLSDLKLIGNRIRGLTAQNSQNVYVWDQDKEYHADIWEKLKEMLPKDPEFHEDQPDICFYLEKDEDIFSKLSYSLSYSSFTGVASLRGKDNALTRLMTYPAMQKLSPNISNAKDYQNVHALTQQTQTLHKPPELQKEPSPQHYLPGGKKYSPVITKPTGMPVYSREGD